MRRRWLLPLTLLPLLLVLACGGSNDGPVDTAGDNIGDRYLRLFEARGFGVSLFVYDQALPPNLARLLNPGLADDADEDDIVSIPVPPDGELLGSYYIRRRDGTSEIWLSYDVAGTDTEVEAMLAEILDETPWQVTGGQSNELFASVSFRSTVSGDIEGFVTAQSLPSDPMYTVTVERDGQVINLELPRGAFLPEIDVRFRELTGGLEITQVLSDDQLQEGDLLTAVGEVAVRSERDLFAAFRALGQIGEPRTAVLYRLTIVSPATVPDPVFVIPRERPLPDGFPAGFLITEDLTVVDVTWNTQTAGDIYQVTLVSERSAFAVAEDYRDALDTAGWDLTGDEAQGFGTVLNFADEESGVIGIATIDQFDTDDSLNSVILQIQVGRGTN